MRRKIVAALSAAVVLTGLGAQPALAESPGAVVNAAECMANPLAANDDSSTPQVVLPFNVNFYGKTYDKLYVNNNGNVTFDAPLSTFTPFGLTGTRTPIIAPFFADVDTRGGGGTVGYGWGNTVYEGKRAFCVTWKSVGYYNNHSDKQNTFQLLLVQHGTSGDMDIVFNYDSVQWETGDASGGSGGLGGSTARAGFSNGSGEEGTSYEMRGSGVPGAFLDAATTGLAKASTDSTQTGRHIFRLRGGSAPLVRYVALGDSYSSGFGMGSYEAGTHLDPAPNDCQRSEKAYSTMVADRLGLNLDFNACQGGVTDDFYQPRGTREGANWGEEPQLNHLSTDTRLLTFTIGGNDVGFADIYSECALGAELLPWNTCNQEDKVRKPLAAKTARLDGGSAGGDTALEKIHPYPVVFADARAKAPYAERVVVGYPTFFPADGADTTFRCEMIKRVDQRWMHEKTVELNEVIKRNAQLYGFRYVDPNPAFVGHEFCSADPWFYGITEDGKVHPTPPGHQAIADAILRELTTDGRPAFMVMPQATVTTTFTVTDLLNLINVAIEWPGSDIQLTLTSPSGKVYNRTAKPGSATGSFGPTWDSLSVPNPERGTWKVAMYGADVDPQGEEAKLSVTRVEVPNKAPTGAFDMTPDGTKLKLDATKSTDTDGKIKAYDWYVQQADGTEQELHGATATATIAAGKQFGVTLVVTDDDGATDYQTRTAVAAGIEVLPGSVIKAVAKDLPLLTPVAILSTKDFDATRTQASSLRVGPAGAKAVTVIHQDVNRDGRKDLVLTAWNPAMGLKRGDTTLPVTGTTTAGVPFVGAGPIKVLG
ncbi:nidogen-like domain-containing protein [Actinoplanes sp. NPDC051494]|uniref:nidogen-like domain-containing protein n=1 Tax=Actinoplanes sp. NPDC051494 TaxID=3363907 RepID=UPI00379C5718